MATPKPPTPPAPPTPPKKGRGKRRPPMPPKPPVPPAPPKPPTPPAPVPPTPPTPPTPPARKARKVKSDWPIWRLGLWILAILAAIAGILFLAWLMMPVLIVDEPCAPLTLQATNINLGSVQTYGENSGHNTVININDHDGYWKNLVTREIGKTAHNVVSAQKVEAQPKPAVVPPPPAPLPSVIPPASPVVSNTDIDIIPSFDGQTFDYVIPAGKYVGFNIIAQNGWVLDPVEFWGDSNSFEQGDKKAPNGNIYYYWYRNHGSDFRVRFTFHAPQQQVQEPQPPPPQQSGGHIKVLWPHFKMWWAPCR